jgi:hypothetical protein
MVFACDIEIGIEIDIDIFLQFLSELLEPTNRALPPVKM